MSVERLTGRERQVCSVLVEHGHNKKTASLLGISESMVRWYLRRIKGKLGVQTLVQVALIWDRAQRAQEFNHADTHPRVPGSYRPVTGLLPETQAGATHTE